MKKNKLDYKFVMNLIKIISILILGYIIVLGILTL